MGIRNPLKKKRPLARGQAGRFIPEPFAARFRLKNEPGEIRRLDPGAAFALSLTVIYRAIVRKEKS